MVFLLLILRTTTASNKKDGRVDLENLDRQAGSRSLNSTQLNSKWPLFGGMNRIELLLLSSDNDNDNDNDNDVVESEFFEN